MIQKAFFRLAIWFSVCFKNRWTTVISLILPIFLVNFTFIYFYSRHELSTGIEQLRNSIISSVVDKASRVRLTIEELAAKTEWIGDELSQHKSVVEHVKKVMEDNSKAKTFSIMYTPAFLSRLSKGEIPDYHLEYGEHLPREMIHPEYYGVSFVRNGDRIEITCVTQQGYQYKNWYHLATLFRRGAWSGPSLLSSTNSTICYYSLPFFYQGEIIGVVAVGFETSELFHNTELTTVSQYGKSSSMFLLSRLGRFLYCNNTHLQSDNIYSLVAEEHRDEGFRLLDTMVSGSTGAFAYSHSTIFYDGAPGSNMWFVHSPIQAGTDWTLVCTFSEREVMWKLYGKMLNIWIWYLIEFLFVALLIVLLMLNIYNPVDAVASMSQMVADGIRDAFVPANYERLKNPMGRLATNFNFMVREMNHYIALEVEEKAKNQAMNKELNLAREIQLSLLPNDREINGDSRIAVSTYFSPIHHVAGDFFDFWKVNDDQAFFLIADVSGKGVAAAIHMSSTKALIRMATKWEKEPGRILGLVNTVIERTNRAKKFVTIFLGFYNIRTGELQYCNGGHPNPLLLGPDSSVREIADNRSCMVGVFSQADYYTSKASIKPGETLFLYTDGITEAMSRKGVLFGEKRLREFCQTMADGQSAGIVSKMASYVTQYVEGRPSDDITMLAIHRKTDCELQED